MQIHISSLEMMLFKLNSRAIENWNCHSRLYNDVTSTTHFKMNSFPFYDVAVDLLCCVNYSGSGRSTPSRSTRPRPAQNQTPISNLSKYPLTPDVLVSTPGARAFLPSEVSTPLAGAMAADIPRCPQTPTEIRKFLGTNNSGAGRYVNSFSQYWPLVWK